MVSDTLYIAGEPLSTSRTPGLRCVPPHCSFSVLEIEPRLCDGRQPQCVCLCPRLALFQASLCIKFATKTLAKRGEMDVVIAQSYKKNRIMMVLLIRVIISPNTL